VKLSGSEDGIVAPSGDQDRDLEEENSACEQRVLAVEDKGCVIGRATKNGNEDY
jgi:hypothetical protein